MNCNNTFCVFMYTCTGPCMCIYMYVYIYIMCWKTVHYTRFNPSIVLYINSQWHMTFFGILATLVSYLHCYRSWRNALLRKTWVSNNVSALRAKEAFLIAVTPVEETAECSAPEDMRKYPRCVLKRFLFIFNCSNPSRGDSRMLCSGRHA